MDYTSVFFLGNTTKVQAQSMSEATNYTIGSDLDGEITENGDGKKYYKFTITESGSIRLTGQAYMEWIYLLLYDSEANELWMKNPSWNSTSEVITINETVYLTSGTYYLCFDRDGDNCGKFNFKIQFTSSDETFIETDRWKQQFNG